ncbi:gluconokinase [Sphingomonas melonis]|nr:gluconokinase [Sphingomonas melonis]
MGVSGSGKSTLSARLGTALGCPVLEGDAFHSAENVAKMQAGHPLTDADRWPWLDRLGAALGAAALDAPGGVAVAACSALKRSYRERLSAASAVPLLFVLLDTGEAEIARRMRTRSGHYMPPSLLGSQLATLERPTPDEPAVTLDASRPVDALTAEALAWIDERQKATGSEDRKSRRST